MSKVIVSPDGCWLYQGKLNNGGYGVFYYEGRDEMAHRAAFHMANGWLPQGRYNNLDHLCRVRRCVNPDHLEPVTQKEQLARSPFYGQKEVCVRGHELTEENVWVWRGMRKCKECGRMYAREYARRKRVAR